MAMYDASSPILKEMARDYYLGCKSQLKIMDFQETTFAQCNRDRDIRNVKNPLGPKFFKLF